MIEATELARRLETLEPIGLRADGTTRLAWTAEDALAGEWFADQAARAGLRVERDPAGNLWACPDADPPWWATGSHLDSVRAGGRFDGALGVCAAFAVAGRARRPVAVISFADEEGARYNTPTFGSRALTGRLDIDEVVGRRDDDGVALVEAMAAAGVDPAGLRRAPEWLGRLRGFVELHIDQSRDLAADGRPAGVVASLASRLRLQVDLEGRADHAGTTPRRERADALLAAARLIVAADELSARQPRLLTTATRIHVEPNALTTIASHVRLWLDARAPQDAAVEAWRAALEQAAGGARMATASRSPAVVFDAGVRRALAEALPRPGRELVSYAGHDAGILAARIPAGMIFVRNERGLSHQRDEAVDLDDAAVAASALLRALEALP